MNLTEIVNNIGFPIVCVICMAKFIKDTQKTYMNERKDFIKALNQINLTLNSILNKLDYNREEDID